MRQRRYHTYIDPNEAEIKRLKHEIWQLRDIVIDLMPDEYKHALKSYYQCESKEDRYRWHEKVVQNIISLAKPIEGMDKRYFADRAYCPLCSKGSLGLYQEGFSLPEGLYRHLKGWGNAHECDVMKAALAQARDYWHEKYYETDLAEETREREQIEERRNIEIVYRIAPDEKPYLIDEHLLGSHTRDERGLAWAEQRLVEIGFHLCVEGNIKCYIREHERVIVYGDPRIQGQLAFRAYPKTQSKKHGAFKYHPFSLPDAWKKDIKDKYEAKVPVI